ncbi:DUF4184 family protein [Microbacterium sp. SA39]|uniref:DUF4184 family protein n=1 Tax=Microbacterium sp. SA39 TaxID=1263625 RepID=UPI0005F9C142|nr:DUF4184 family protein [Microbacterium sp. SA39]KJQ55953.1 hypothetical protein RS85_00156 [Microbacterium sp. SA39]
MPFTPSHAVIALPFVRTPLVPAAIAIGSMTPDLPLFVRGVGLNYSFTHTFANVAWTAILALVLFLVWRVVLRPAVPELAPRWIARRLPEEWSDSGIAVAGKAVGVGEKRPYLLLLAASLVLGVLSHIVWDVFTHEDRWGVRLVPGLDQMWGPLAGFKWLQHGSSLLGLAIVGVWALLWLRRRDLRDTETTWLPHGVRVAWWLSLPVILVAAWVAGLVVLGPLDAEFTVAHLAYRVLPPACAVWGGITLLLCVVLVLRRRPHHSG